MLNEVSDWIAAARSLVSSAAVKWWVGSKALTDRRWLMASNVSIEIGLIASGAEANAVVRVFLPDVQPENRVGWQRGAWMTDVPWIDWYQSLAKPSWTPAPRTIGLIWQILYPVIIASFGYVFVQAARGRLPLLVALPFAINLVANLIFTPIQFGMRNLPLAAVDILVVWGTIVWMMLAIWPHARLVAAAQVPYFVWVSIATVLQLSITWMNRA